MLVWKSWRNTTTFSQQAISELWKLFLTRMQEKKISYERMSTRTHFVKEARGNLEIAYYITDNLEVVLLR